MPLVNMVKWLTVVHLKDEISWLAESFQKLLIFCNLNERIY